MTTDPKGTPTGLAPSNDTQPQKRRKVLMGRGLVGLIGGVAITAFALYLFIVAYGLFTGT
ncbi:hypothetical protein MRBLMR1_003881 [Neorhizobium sp. LMR1-1-1.1]